MFRMFLGFSIIKLMVVTTLSPFVESISKIVRIMFTSACNKHTYRMHVLSSSLSLSLSLSPSFSLCLTIYNYFGSVFVILLIQFCCSIVIVREVCSTKLSTVTERERMEKMTLLKWICYFGNVIAIPFRSDHLNSWKVLCHGIVFFISFVRPLWLLVAANDKSIYQRRLQ